MPRVNHQAIKNLDYEQYKMVREALHERATVLKVAPHLSYQMPIMLPIYKWWQVLPVAVSKRGVLAAVEAGDRLADGVTLVKGRLCRVVHPRHVVEYVRPGP